MRSFDIEESKGFYDIWFNAEPISKGDGAFLFEGLTKEEYYNLIDVFMQRAQFRAQIPKEVGKLTYAPKN